MANETKGKKTDDKEGKVGVIQASELEGSDADKAYANEVPEIDKEGKEHKGSDADSE